MNHERARTAGDYIFIVTHAQFIHYFVEANIIGARCSIAVGRCSFETLVESCGNYRRVKLEVSEGNVI